MADWYRQKAWSTEIEEFYFSKLKKSRDKAQYLKIQAIELVETKQTQLLDVAEMLLNKLFTDFPENRFDRSSSLVTMGKIYDLRGNPDKALAYYKQAMEFEKVYPQVKLRHILILLSWL
ncbi:MAG: hypothetical protein JKY70_14885 [Mucilaginibacter sp.]|nr:hypothetical protein [Mucilaginibacter sp.]